MGSPETKNELKGKVGKLRDHLCGGLVERQEAATLCLLAALAGEHVLLVGPPGTAKSELARRLCRVFSDGKYFERLLTRFTVPEELFGPISIKGLEQDRFERCTDGYLPTAAIAFVDEVFKANSAILNSLLTLMNERLFHNGTMPTKAPLVCLVGASNELPQEDGLDALLDRFLVRYEVLPVSDKGFVELFGRQTGEFVEPPEDSLLTMSELEEIRREARKIPLSGKTLVLVEALRKFLQEKQIAVSDRRWRKAVELLKVASHVNGNSGVGEWECFLLQHLVWRKPEERALIREWYLERLGAADPREPSRNQALLASWSNRLKTEQNRKTQAMNKSGNLLFLGPDGKKTAEAVSVVQHEDQEGNKLWKHPMDSNKVVNERQVRDHFRHYGGGDADSYMEIPASQVTTRRQNEPLLQVAKMAPELRASYLSQIGQQLAEIEKHADGLDEKERTLAERLRNHLWLPEDFAGPALASLQQQYAVAEKLHAGFLDVKKGFEAIPTHGSGAEG